MPPQVGSHVGCHVADRSEGRGERQRGRISMMGFSHWENTLNFVGMNPAGSIETIFKGYNLLMEGGITVKTTRLHPTVIAKRLNHQIRPWPDMGDQGLLGAEHCTGEVPSLCGKTWNGKKQVSLSSQSLALTRLQSRVSGD